MLPRLFRTGLSPRAVELGLLGSLVALAAGVAIVIAG